jgi:hypothetical protein
MGMSLINKSYKEYSALSRYESFPYYYDTIKQKYIYGITAQLDCKTPYSLYTTEEVETFDSLALKAYGNPTYFWIISNFNRLLDCFDLIPINTDIKIPSISSITFEVS